MVKKVGDEDFENNRNKTLDEGTKKPSKLIIEKIGAKPGDMFRTNKEIHERIYGETPAEPIPNRSK